MSEVQDKFASIIIPPDPDERYFNCKQVNQNGLRNEVFWIVDYEKKNIERDGTVSEKYVQKCLRNLDDSEELAFKFFTGCRPIKYKLDYIRDSDAYNFPIQVKLIGDGRNFDIDVLKVSVR